MKSSRMVISGLIFVFAALAGCEAKLTVDLGATGPANPAATQVLVDLLGVEFEKDSGGSERLEFNDPVSVNLANLVRGNVFRLFTDEQLPDGHYTGARLIFDTSNDSEPTVGFLDGTQIDLNLGTAEFSAVDFTVSKDDSTNDSIVLTLDLRQSLAFDDNTDEFTLTPIARAVRPEDTGQLSGVATANCVFGEVSQGGAVYLFTNPDVQPDDYDGAEAEPYLTTAIEFISGSAAPPSYSFQFLPEGDYTLVMTCSGNRENGLANDDVRFQFSFNVNIDAEQQETRNIP